MFYDEGSDWEIIVAAVLTVGAIFFQIWSKYDDEMEESCPKTIIPNMD